MTKIKEKKGFGSLSKGRLHSFELLISEEMVKAFADLTGDYNSLHIDKVFGRRTMYRKNTAHGMLPVSFICLFDFFIVKSYSFEFQKVSANFIKPVFINQEVILEGIIADFNLSDKSIACGFTLKDKNSNAILTAGTIKGNFVKQGRLKREDANKKGTLRNGIALSPLKEKILEIGQISKKDKASFKISITDQSLKEICAIFSNGIRNSEPPYISEIESHVRVNNVLANLMFSSFVGMSLPGRFATFTNFSCAFLKNIEKDKVYELTGEVAFKSESTESLLIIISVAESYPHKNNFAIKGEINVKVNKPPIKMPTLPQLRKEEMDWGLKGKVVLITGASRGLGETTAKMFALYGAKVVVNYFHGKDDAEGIVKEIKKNGGAALAIQADVSKEEDVNRMVNKIIKTYKRIDVLVNNAIGDTAPPDFLDLSWEKVQHDIDITVKGSFNCCKKIIPVMIKNGGGKIINMSTIFVDAPASKQTKYIIAKSGLVGLTRSLAVECASNNILVNMVEPSIVPTDLSAHVSKMFMDAMANESPLKKNASPVDIAKTIIFLASSYSNYTTGQKIMVTGGRPPFL